MPGLGEQVTDFAAKLDAVVGTCLPDSPGVAVNAFGTRYGLSPMGQTERQGGVPLSVNGEFLSTARFSPGCASTTYVGWTLQVST